MPRSRQLSRFRAVRWRGNRDEGPMYESLKTGLAGFLREHGSKHARTGALLALPLLARNFMPLPNEGLAAWRHKGSFSNLARALRFAAQLCSVLDGGLCGFLRLDSCWKLSPVQLVHVSLKHVSSLARAEKGETASMAPGRLKF